MRWRLTLEEFGPELRYIKGEHNIVADALSRLEMMSVEDLDIHSSIDCFAADAEDFPKDFPLSYAQLRHEQRKDLDIMQEFQKHLHGSEPLYQEKTFAHGDKGIYPCHTKRKNCGSQSTPEESC